MKNFSIKRSSLKKILQSTGAILIWIALWQLVFMAVGKEVLIASPLSVLKRIFELAAEKEFWLISLNSLFSVLKGWLAGILGGVLLSLITSSSAFFRKLFSPLVGMIKATPVASFIILALIFVPAVQIPALMSFLIVMPVIWSNVSAGISAVPLELLEVAQIFAFGVKKKLRTIYIPSIMPFFLAACTTSFGFAWKASIAAEVLSTPKNSIGTQLYNAKIYIETIDLFAWTLVIILFSIIFERVLLYLLKKVRAKGYFST